jgi:hypothetical protein
MPRIARVFIPGVPHHITQRAIDEKMFVSKMAIDSDIFSSCWSIPPSTG